jgi:hypothetical protein
MFRLGLCLACFDQGVGAQGRPRCVRGSRRQPPSRPNASTGLPGASWSLSGADARALPAPLSLDEARGQAEKGALEFLSVTELMDKYFPGDVHVNAVTAWGSQDAQVASEHVEVG